MTAAASFPPMKAVKTRGEGASHEGPQRTHNEDAFGFVDDALGSLAVVADGMGGHHSGRNAADLVVNTCIDLYRGRKTTILDELAEAWWVAEHGDGKGSSGSLEKAARLRPYSTLPIGDRVELRERVASILKKRVPDSMGDVAVLEGETSSMLAIPERALTRANAEVYRKSSTDIRWRGNGAAAACAIFAAGQASIGHAGDCRVSRIRGGAIEALTQEHTLQNDYTLLQVDLTPEQLAEIPRNVITRAIGMTDTVHVATCSVPLETGDIFLLMTDGLYLLYSNDELLRAVRALGTRAASDLVERGKQMRPDHPGDNLAIVVVEIL